ncbi:MAG: PEGA domain-containing protein [Acidobacteria bacterium]|nr:PEGA domain-containing protein [Acidobacteriota bacterium]
MKSRRFLEALVALLVAVVGTVGANSAERPANISSEAIDPSTVMLPCTPVGTYWTGPPVPENLPPGPGLAVVSLDIRPKSARVHLDGRFVGRAKYFDGWPGYLYLEPGKYRLEIRYEGYSTVAVDLDATAGCRFDLKHRLERGKSAADEREKTFGKGKPFQRVFAPKSDSPPEIVPRRDSAPDPKLRRDLDLSAETIGEPDLAIGASLRLHVSPDSASVLIDGVFVATARELQSMEKPLATGAGAHRLVVRAPGHVEFVRDVSLEPGEVLELEISLSEE